MALLRMYRALLQIYGAPFWLFLDPANHGRHIMHHILLFLADVYGSFADIRALVQIHRALLRMCRALLWIFSGAYQSWPHQIGQLIESFWISEQQHTHGWVMAHKWISHVMYTNITVNMMESFLTWEEQEQVTSCTCMSHGTHVNESWHTYERVMARIQTSKWIWWNRLRHRYSRNESCHACAWLMAHVWMSHGTFTNIKVNMVESFLICEQQEWVMSCTCMSHCKSINGSWHMHEWDMARIQTS